MSGGTKTALGASVVLNLLLIAFGRGSFAQGLALVPVVLIALIALGIAGLTFAFGGSSPDYRRAAKGIFAFGVVAGSCLFSLPLGQFVNQYDIEQARAFCDSLRPALERHRERTGRYPEDWPRDAAAGRLPRLLDESSFYRCHPGGRSFDFHFTNPAGMMNGFNFDSRAGEWTEWD